MTAPCPQTTAAGTGESSDRGRVLGAESASRGLAVAESTAPSSVEVANPHRYVDGLEGTVHDADQGVADRVWVDGVFQPGGKCATARSAND